MSALIESAGGFALLQPSALLLLLLLPALLLLRSRGRRSSLPFAPLPVVAAAPLPASARSRLRHLSAILRAGGLLLLVVALARPAVRTILPLRAEGIDLVLCIDASSSMTAEDTGGAGSRLAAARKAADAFVAARPADRIGLLRFARWPDLLCPPTLDHAALREILAGVGTVEGDGPEDATGIGAAVARAARVLAEGDSPSKVVVLLTDGEENVAAAGEPGAIPPLHAAQLCQRLGVRVHVVAAGPGTAAQGRPAPDRRAVRAMAERTGGRFFEARDAAALAAVYADIDAQERGGFDRPEVAIEERFAPFLLAALTLLLAGRFLGGTWLETLP